MPILEDLYNALLKYEPKDVAPEMQKEAKQKGGADRKQPCFVCAWFAELFQPPYKRGFTEPHHVL